MQQIIALVTLALLAGVRQAGAVCGSGQMAVGRAISDQLEGTNDVLYYNGFLMSNNCGIIAQNGETEDANQMCSGGYSGGAAVSCSGGNPTAARDTQGHWWNCWHTDDTSCNKYLGWGSYYVTSCCSRQ